MTEDAKKNDDMEAMDPTSLYPFNAEVKTISLPIDMARRWETGTETAADIEWFRHALRNRYPDMIF